MTSLDRAKRFLAAKTAKIALAAVPLALAVPASFGQVSLTFNTGTCTVSAGFPATSGSCALQQFSAIGGNSSANWLDLYTTTNIGPGNGSILLNANGTASGGMTSGETLPVSWDFSFSQIPTQGGNLTSVSPMDVQISFFINGTTASGSFFQDLGNVGLGETTGSGFLTMPTFTGTDTISSYSIQFNATNVPSNFRLSIPQGTSLDLNDVASATPEPSTFVLGGAGMGLLGLMRRRFRRRKV